MEDQKTIVTARKDVLTDFKQLTITSDGIRTHIVVDGEDISARVTKVVYEHDTCALDAIKLVIGRDVEIEVVPAGGPASE